MKWGNAMVIKIIKYVVLTFISIILICFYTISTAAQQIDISVNTPINVNVGRSFNVNFTVTNDCGNIAALKFTVKYSDENLSLKGAECALNGEVKFYAENGTATVICLFSDGLKTPDNFLTLTFTAVTGQSAGTQVIELKCTEAVDTGLNDITVAITEKVEIDIIRSSSEAAEGSTQNSQRSSGSNVSSKSSAASSLTSKSQSSAVSRSSADKLKDNTSIFEFENDNIFNEFDTEDDYPSVGYLLDENSKMKNIFAGIGIGVSVMIILFVTFRIGQMSRRDKINSKDIGITEKSESNEDQS